VDSISAYLTSLLPLKLTGASTSQANTPTAGVNVDTAPPTTLVSPYQAFYDSIADGEHKVSVPTLANFIKSSNVEKKILGKDFYYLEHIYIHIYIYI
jgi:hypothetical protein